MSLTKDDITAITNGISNEVRIVVKEELQPFKEHFDRKLTELDQRLSAQIFDVGQRVTELDQRLTMQITEMDHRFTNQFKEMDRRFTMVGQRLNEVNIRLERIDVRMNHFDFRLSRIEAALPFDNPPGFTAQHSRILD